MEPGQRVMLCLALEYVEQYKDFSKRAGIQNQSNYSYKTNNTNEVEIDVEKK